MKPIPFEGSNVVFGKGQPEYLELPAHSDGTTVTSCWQLTFKERMKVLVTGRVFFSQVTFGTSLQPQRPSVDNPVRSERTSF
jgi:hypothetical protein